MRPPSSPDVTDGVETPNGGSLRRLVRCVRALGLRLGWKYWRIQNKANVNPWIALQWADNCERMADNLRDVNPELAAAHRDWARQLRAAYESYKWGKAPNDEAVRPPKGDVQ